jgi:hypothetical protein
VTLLRRSFTATDAPPAAKAVHEAMAGAPCVAEKYPAGHERGAHRRQGATSDDFRIDWDRERRTSTAEAVFSAGKSPEQNAAILRSAKRRRLLLSRLTTEALRAPAGRSCGATRPRSAVADRHLRSAGSGRGGGFASLLPAPPTFRWRARRRARWPSTARAPSGRRCRPVAADGRDRDEIRRHALVIAVAGMEGHCFPSSPVSSRRR